MLLFSLLLNAELLLCFIKPHSMKGSLCLMKHYAMKMYGGILNLSPRIHKFGTEWLWVVNFMPQERAPAIHFIRGCLGPRAGLDVVAKKEVLSPAAFPNPIFQPVAQPLYWLNLLDSSVTKNPNWSAYCSRNCFHSENRCYVLDAGSVTTSNDTRVFLRHNFAWSPCWYCWC
jgi:hypothetical protein